MASKSKRLEALANEYVDGVSLHATLYEAHRDAKFFDGALRVAVRLVELRPGEVVVLKAKLRELRHGEDDSSRA